MVTIDLKTPATKKDLVEMEKRMEDRMATKNDLLELEKRMEDRMATKNDLLELEKRMEKRMATKEDLKTFGVKLRDEMKQMESELKVEIMRGFNVVAENLHYDAVGANSDEIGVLKDARSNHERRIRALETRTGMIAA